MKARILTLCLLMLVMGLPACDSGGSDDGNNPGQNQPDPDPDPDPEPDPDPDPNPDPDPEPDPTPDPDPISYISDIQSIFSNSCGGSGCHIGETTNGVNLSSYSNVMNSVGAQYGGPIVIPGNASGSPIVNKISSSTPQFGARMPQTGPALPALEISRIRQWIDDGAPNN